MRTEYKDLAEAHLKHLGVHWDMMPSYRGLDNCFSSFTRNASAPKGNGARALREVIALADQLGHELTLFTSGEKLTAYYQQFGFVREAHPHFQVVMRRPVPADAVRRKEVDPAIAEELGWLAGYISACQAQIDARSVA